MVANHGWAYHARRCAGPGWLRVREILTMLKTGDHIERRGPLNKSRAAAFSHQGQIERDTVGIQGAQRLRPFSVLA